MAVLRSACDIHGRQPVRPMGRMPKVRFEDGVYPGGQGTWPVDPRGSLPQNVVDALARLRADGWKADTIEKNQIKAMIKVVAQEKKLMKPPHKAGYKDVKRTMDKSNQDAQDFPMAKVAQKKEETEEEEELRKDKHHPKEEKAPPKEEKVVKKAEWQRLGGEWSESEESGSWTPGPRSGC